MRIAIATVRPLPEPDPDEAPLREALRAGGAEVALCDWHDETVDPASFDVVVLRSTWDSHLHPDRFLAWVRRTAAATRLLNPAPAVEWNLHKRYLRELEAAGIPIVPTVWIERGLAPGLDGIVAELGSTDLVVKPAVSAASDRTARFGPDESADAQAFLETVARDDDVMVQPYLASTETVGERAIVWIDGKVTHAVRKTPRFRGQDESVSSALSPDPAEVAFAERVLAAAARALADSPDLLYARIDVMVDDEGAPRLSELELIEPSLFLVQHPPALARLAAAVHRRAAVG